MKAADPHFNTHDLCERYRISKRTLSRWLQDSALGLPKPFTINRRLYWRRSEILGWELRREGIDPDLPNAVAGLQVVSGPISDYGQLVAALIKQRQRLKMTCMEIDAVSGMQEGYTNKLENWGQSYGRGAGPEILSLWIGSLRTALVLVELPRRPRRTKAH
ncbi:helix-turn-helix transcriptional regulator [Rhizobium rhizogenes]|uniref:helix-turn-helix transcriptional regulator n=1 Tax=Rhizobium rhizogenes TaxID=359 RepID=UPI0024BECA76|nr:DNA-binding protein [Rhizobium rhizogenes]MDJ1633202.1 DNA-binding protein [Rhizobium rhizogenes]